MAGLDTYLYSMPAGALFFSLLLFRPQTPPLLVNVHILPAFCLGLVLVLSPA